MFRFGNTAPQDLPPERPVLDLSGPRLRRGLETLASSAEDDGGVEQYISGLRFKAAVLQQALADGRAATVDRDTFLGLSAFIAPVRRRIGAWLGDNDFESLRGALVSLLDGAEGTGDPASVDARIAQRQEDLRDGRRRPQSAAPDS